MAAVEHLLQMSPSVEKPPLFAENDEKILIATGRKNYSLLELHDAVYRKVW